MGMFYVRSKDLNSSNSTTLFLDDEPSSIFTSPSRSFYVHEPLQMSVDTDHKLCVRFFSAIPIQDVTILCQFSQFSNEYFELAHYEVISAFHESHMPIPLVSGRGLFKSESGRLVEIPAQPDLSNNDCRFKFRTNDPYMQKIATIKPKWYISFSNYDAGTNPATDWRFMTPEFCRQGMVLVSNMAYMYSSQEFNELISRHHGQLHDDSSVPIPADRLFQQINAHGELRMGLITGFQGYAGGWMYGLADYRYRDHYWDCAPRDNIRTTPFHEFAHCIGYGHLSNMTYGNGLWTTICSQLMWDMGNAGKLLVNSMYVLSPKE